MLKQAGMSIVELMVAIAIGIVISGALGTLFVTTTKAKHEVDRMGEQIENGRIGMELLTQELRHAGFWDTLNYQTLPVAAANICDTDDDDLKVAVPVYVQGIDNVAAGSIPACLQAAQFGGVRVGTDIVMVRRAATCENGAANCTSIAPYFQASNCTPPGIEFGGATGTVALGSELSGDPATDWFDVQTDPTALTLHSLYCDNAAAEAAGRAEFSPRRRYIARIFYIANNDTTNDGVPTLRMAELQKTSAGAASWVPVSLATGIEQLQLEYGQDTDSNGIPDTYAVPSTLAEWRRVVSVKVHLLSRNSTPTPGYLNTKTYTLGDVVVPAFNDAVRRHTFSGLVSLVNPIAQIGS
jgi:type IV pilus assembly protein PilW